MEGLPTDTPAEQQIVRGSGRSALAIFLETHWRARASAIATTCVDGIKHAAPTLKLENT